MAGPSRTAVHIFLDTNALFTEAADRLIAVDLSEFISKSFDNDPKPQWYIPAVVTGERRFQMIERANRLLPQLDKVEKLLGHNLGITGDVLSTRVDEAIKRQIDAHNLHEVGFDQSLVDWQEMVRRSVLRQPPFGTGESEKGFRDAVVLETFCQIVSELPKSSQACRVVLLSNDERLVEAAQERMAERSNVTFARDLDTVKTILNALASEITQDAVNELLPHASDLFFKVDEKKALYYSAEVGEKIRSTFGDVLKKIPQDFGQYIDKNYKHNFAADFFSERGPAPNFLELGDISNGGDKIYPATNNRTCSFAGRVGWIDWDHAACAINHLCIDR